MSATGRGVKRITNDNYPTPEWATHRFIDRALKRGIPLVGRLLEPCAGDGAIIRAFQSHELMQPAISPVAPHWTANELRAECVPSLTKIAHRVYVSDFMQRAPRLAAYAFDAVVSNPPFSLAEEVIKASLQLAPWVVMLLRINFLGSEDRAAWLSTNAPDLYTLPNRPPFAKNKDGKPGTDATEYAWFVWGPHSRGAVRGTHEALDVTPLEVRKRHVAMLKAAA